MSQVHAYLAAAYALKAKPSAPTGTDYRDDLARLLGSPRRNTIHHSSRNGTGGRNALAVDEAARAGFPRACREHRSAGTLALYAVRI
jgi:hypothetical protein